MRLFFAIELSGPLRAEVRRLQSLLRTAGADVRWVRPESAHFTLQFLGEVGNDEIQPIDGAARSAAARSGPARVQIAALGTFPSSHNPRVVWIGVRGRLEPLALLQQQLGEGLAELGFEPDRRAFRPHVTLGRVRGGRGLWRLRDLLEQHRDTRLGSLNVRRFVLLQSRLSPSGARYEPVASYPLEHS